MEKLPDVRIYRSLKSKKWHLTTRKSKKQTWRGYTDVLIVDTAPAVGCRLNGDGGTCLRVKRLNQTSWKSCWLSEYAHSRSGYNINMQQKTLMAWDWRHYRQQWMVIQKVVQHFQKLPANRSNSSASWKTQTLETFPFRKNGIQFLALGDMFS